VKPMNLVYIMSDQHNPRMMGCAGHPIVQTPNLDSLAARGVRFNHAYTNCPICVPARASHATGRYVHQIAYWDNGTPYDGRFPSWGHRLGQQGHHVTTIGKLHYRSDADDNGFPDERLPMHVHEGEGDVFGLLRDDMPVMPGARKRFANIGPGDSDYSRYDLAIADASVRWLHQEARAHDKPWVLFVSFVRPHPPWQTPPEFYELYPLDRVDLPKNYSLAERPMHPALEANRHRISVEDELPEEVIRRAVAAYYGLCTFLDWNVGKVLKAIDDAGLSDNTRVIYTSDHGEMLGEHGLWFKSAMYDGAAAIPMIAAGPDIPSGVVADTNVSLVDSFPTILEAVGVAPSAEEADLPGASLWPIARGEGSSQRAVLSEYHASGSPSGIFMLRGPRYKYIHYTGFAPQLFDLVADPEEAHDLANDPTQSDVLKACEQELRGVLNPEAVDRQAKADQARIIEAHGGRAAVLARGPSFVNATPAPREFRVQGD